MNIVEAQTMSTLRVPITLREDKPKTRSARYVARQILSRCERNGYPYKNFPNNDHGAKRWARKYLDSKEFTLMAIDINAAASPNEPQDPKRVEHYIKCNALEFDPIVVDTNKRKRGRTHLGYIPEVIKVDGKHRAKAMLAQGHTKTMAWVGCKAIKKIKPSKMIQASSLKEVLATNGNHTIHASSIDIYSAVAPSVGVTTPRQDSGEGSSRPADHMHAKKKKKNKMKSNAGIGKGGGAAPKQAMPMRPDVMDACGARSSGSLVRENESDSEVPPDASDSGSSVDASDRLQWFADRPQNYAPGTGPGYTDQFGDPPRLSPGSGVGPRVVNKGASKSEFARTVHAGGPGSGPRPVNDSNHKGLTEAGWKHIGNIQEKDKTLSKYTHPKHEGHVILVHPSGRTRSVRPSVDAGKTVKKMWTKKKRVS